MRLNRLVVTLGFLAVAGGGTALLMHRMSQDQVATLARMSDLKATEMLPGEHTAMTTLRVVGGVYRLFKAGEQPVLMVNGKAGTAVTLTGSDVQGQPNGWSKAVTLTGNEARIELPNAIGYQCITATWDNRRRFIDLAVLPEQPAGARPESFLGTNAEAILLGDDLGLITRLGLRVQRVPMSLDAATLDRQWSEAKAAGSWVLPVVTGSAPASALAIQAKMAGPPLDNAAFAASWETLLRNHPEWTTIEGWNEPWIFNWTWAGTPAEYRAWQSAFAAMTQRVNPAIRLLAGSSPMFVEDHLAAHPDSVKQLAGITQHAYMGGGELSSRTGCQLRTIDQGAQLARRLGVADYLTEGGQETRGWTAMDDLRNNAFNARKIVHYFVNAALAGVYQANIKYDVGYGPEWTMSNATVATLASHIEDRPCVADIWPANQLITGAIFANARTVDAAVKALPRAGELSARWTVPVPAERAQDATAVAVVFATTGLSNALIDTAGTLTIADATGLTAVDCTGRPIAPQAGALVLPFGEWPVYVRSDTLGVVTLRERLANAIISGLTAVNASACSLDLPADQAQTLRVRVQNQVNVSITGTVVVTPQGGMPIQAPFTAPAGALIEVPVAWPGVATAADNQYGITVATITPAGTASRQQIVASAQFIKRSIIADGNLADWGAAVPVTLDSAALRAGVDLAAYLASPERTEPSTEGRVVARLYSAWDDQQVALAVVVDEATLANSAGEPAKRGDATLPYKNGLPDGLGHVRYAGDSLMFAFGMRDRVPGQGRQLDDPWAWKGFFYDTDYCYVAHTSTDHTSHLLRMWGPDTPRRNGYQTVAEPTIGAIAGAHMAITRDDQAKRTVYELTIPRSELALFDPAAKRLRFGFQLITDQAVEGRGALRWSEMAGVFDHWNNLGSFAPTWEEQPPCQTFFAISH
jgi:hypothetical protein